MARLLLLALACVLLPAQDRTPLDEYVHAEDPAYAWSEVRRLPGDGYTAHVLDLTSQSWVTPQPADRTLWRHWLVVYVPEATTSDVGLLMISGGSNGGEPPSEPNKSLAAIAKATKTVTAELRMIPNQALSYEGDPFGERKEDELIAYNWKRFLDEGDPIWLTRLPMTKAAVRALDAIGEFTAEAGVEEVERFYVMGGSKRGWTTWTTAAVDDRVIGISPIVIDLLNIVPSFIHHYRAYGFWAPAVADYFREGVMDRVRTPEYEELLRIVGPYSYRDRYTMPKFLVHAAGDQFFLPDSSQFYFDDLPGEKYLRYVPNADHSLKGSDAFESLTAFYDAVVNDRPRPRFDWSFEDDGAIRVKTADPPAAVKLWTAHNPRHRDFRLESVGPIWKSQALTPTAEGVYRAQPRTPESGFLAYFVELTYPSGLKHPFKLTTGVRVLPDRYPYPEPEPGMTHVGPKKQ